MVKGKAKSAFKAIENARVNLAPLRFGSGIKGKVLDAIQTRTPSIVTPIASEGLNHHPWPGKIADTPDMFAKSAVTLHECQADWLNASQACQAFANKYKDINLSHHATTDLVETAIVEIAERRQKNFWGAMLRHHSMASTKYMTQWIEAKNK